jgi:ABC-type glycerol-3-phosphate transport system permease component
MKTLTLGIAQFQTDQGVAYELQMAIAVLGMLPLIALFVAMQRAFVSGIVMTGLKG